MRIHTNSNFVLFFLFRLPLFAASFVCVERTNKRISVVAIKQHHFVCEAFALCCCCCSLLLLLLFLGCARDTERAMCPWNEIDFWEPKLNWSNGSAKVEHMPVEDREGETEMILKYSSRTNKEKRVEWVHSFFLRHTFFSSSRGPRHRRTIFLWVPARSSCSSFFGWMRILYCCYIYCELWMWYAAVLIMVHAK